MTAVDLHTAIDQAPSILSPIGTCVTELISFARERDLDSDEELDDEDDERGDDERGEEEGDKADNPAPVKRLRHVREDIYNLMETVETKCNKAFTNSVVVMTWNKFFSDAAPDYLIIPGVDFDDVSITTLLEKAPVKAGTFGDAKALETKVDEAVRKASDYYYADGHFTVSDAVVQKAVKIWCEDMYPSDRSAVRAVPYKVRGPAFPL